MLKDRDLNIKRVNPPKGKKGKKQQNAVPAVFADEDKENGGENGNSAQSTPSGWKSVASVPRSPMHTGLSPHSMWNSIVSPLSDASLSPNNNFFQNIYSPAEGNSSKMQPYASPCLTMKPSANHANNDHNNHMDNDNNERSPLTPIEKYKVIGTKIPISKQAQARNRRDSWITLGSTAPSQVANTDGYTTHQPHYAANTATIGNQCNNDIRASSPGVKGREKRRSSSIRDLRRDSHKNDARGVEETRAQKVSVVDEYGMEVDTQDGAPHRRMYAITTLLVVVVAIACYFSSIGR